MEECHDLALKAAAGERVFSSKPSPIHAYAKEIERLRPTFDRSSGAMILSALRENSFMVEFLSGALALKVKEPSHDWRRGLFL